MAEVTPNFRLALVLGGAKSGKSRYGLTLAARYPAPRLFVATGQARDAEMAARIARHQKDRGPQWQTKEEPLALAATIAAAQEGYGVILVDCLTLWLSNLMLRQDQAPAQAEADCALFIKALVQTKTPVILISNEVGWGIVPENPLARRFRDLAGRLHQQLAQIADLVTLVVAGLPLTIKGE